MNRPMNRANEPGHSPRRRTSYYALAMNHFYTHSSLALALFITSALPACGGPQRLPKEEQSVMDTLQQMTGHNQLHPWRQREVLSSGLKVDDILGHTIKAQSDRGTPVIGPRAWQGQVIGIADPDQQVDLELSGRRFGEFKGTLERLFGLQFSASYEYRVRLSISWHPIQLSEPQPALEFLGDEAIFQQRFISSVAFASRVSMTAFKETRIEGGVELAPVNLALLSPKAGTSTTESNTMEAANVIFGYQTVDASNWQAQSIDAFPQVQLEVLNPKPEQVIQSPRMRIQVKVADYAALGDKQGRLQIYAWIQKVGGNQGVLSPIGAPVDLQNGIFELLTNIGGLDGGNGERYSIVVFGLFYRLHNIDQLTQLPTTSYTRPARDNGRASVVVTRQDLIN